MFYVRGVKCAPVEITINFITYTEIAIYPESSILEKMKSFSILHKKEETHLF